MPLEKILTLIPSKIFNRDKALLNHLNVWIDKKITLKKMLSNFTQTIDTQKRGLTISNREKFKGLKSIAENETKYSDKPINKAFEKIRNGSYDDIQKTTDLLNQILITAFKTNNP